MLSKLGVALPKTTVALEILPLISDTSLRDILAQNALVYRNFRAHQQ